MIHRIINISTLNSFFLFGPRGTGKSTLLRGRFSPGQAHFIDLLNSGQEDRFSRHPEVLRQEVAALSPSTEWVVIDEIQKVPQLLDEVHALIESTSLKFALTGSSARKLKRGGANLLAGRAHVNSLFPFTHRELGNSFDLVRALQWGTLPKAWLTEDAEERREYLRAYALTYLKEEIQAEQIVRRLTPFRNFLEVAAQSNGQIVNYSKIGRDIGVDTKTVQSFFEILEETLVGIQLQPYHRSIRKRQRVNPKFYFFDPGVKRALERTLTVDLLPQTSDYGNAFEHFVILEAFRLNSYLRKDFAFSYLRTRDDAEIDLIVERPGRRLALIEIKSTDQVREEDVASLARLKKNLPESETFCLSRDAVPKKIGEVQCLPWDRGLTEIGL